MAWSGLFEERKALPILLLALKHLATRRRRDEQHHPCPGRQPGSGIK